MRKHGWQLPYHPLQVVAVAVFLALGFAFYVFFAPFVGKQFYQYIVIGNLTASMAYFTSLLNGDVYEKRNETIQQLIELEKERLNAAEERERSREERERAREERDKRMYEMSILVIDTSTMEAPLAQYYKSLKDDILK